MSDPVAHLYAILAKAEGCPIPHGSCECPSSFDCVLAAVLDEIAVVDKALGPWLKPPYAKRGKAIGDLREAAGARDECP
jgi:hypothetical protein